MSQKPPGAYDKILKANSARKEFAPSTPIRKRPAAVHPIQSAAIRRQAAQRTYYGEEVYEEELGGEEIVVDPQQLFGNEYERDSEEAGSSETSSSISNKKMQLCPFRIGMKMEQCQLEQLKIIEKQIVDSTRSRLQFDYTTVDNIIAKGTDEGRLLAFGLQGVMKTLEVVQEKWVAKKPASSSTTLHATLNPRKFLNSEPIMVADLNGQGTINVNATMSSMPACSSSLRSVVHAAVNHWIASVMDEKERVHYSVSLRPQAPQISFPLHMQNAPMVLLAETITLAEGTDVDIELEISMLFRGHLTHIFNTARYLAKKQVPN